MGFLSIFGLGNSRLRDALRRGATIIDVRPANEFDQGRIRSSYNIPVDRLNINIQRIRQMRKPIIVCSNSEADGDRAVALLKSNGIENTLNGGNWARLLRVIRSL